MELDDFIDTGRGVTVRDASPDYLDELLAEYSVLQRADGYDPDEFLLPGLSRAQIIDAWAERGVTVPEEAVRLWQWHNGSPFGRFPGTDQDSLAEALQSYDQIPKGYTGATWNPEWITVWGVRNVAMQATAASPPVIRAVDGVYEWVGWDERVQAISFCTVIAMGIYGREHGLYPRNDHGLPDGSSGSRWPEMLRRTLLSGW